MKWLLLKNRYGNTNIVNADFYAKQKSREKPLKGEKQRYCIIVQYSA